MSASWSATARCNRTTRSRGKNGVSVAAVTIQLASGHSRAAHSMPASTPASGPAKPSMESGTMGRP